MGGMMDMNWTADKRDLAQDPDHSDAVTLLESFVDNMKDHLDGFHDVTHTGEIDLIETHHVSGFIPFTNGGFELVAYANFASASGSGCEPEAVKDMIASTLKDCREQFCKDHDLPEGTDPWDEEQVGEEMRELYWDYEHTWLCEGTTYFYKVRVILYDADNSDNETGEPEALICCGINTDLEYGRDTVPWLTHYGGKAQQTMWGFERTVKLSEITPELLAEIEDKAHTALANS